MTLHRLTEFGDPQGGRNMVRQGDAVRVDPGAGEHSRWPARVQYAETDDEGTLVGITVVGGPGFEPALPFDKQTAPASTRTVVPSRVHRKSQTHINKRK